MASFSRTEASGIAQWESLPWRADGNGEPLSRLCSGKAASIQFFHGISLVLRREVAVAAHHRESLVPQELRDRPQIDACHRKPTGEGMPQIVESKIL